jgi:hypothetical protein
MGKHHKKDDEEDGICPHFVLRSQCMDCKMAEAKAKIANAVTPHVLGLAMITDAEKITVRLAKEKEVCWGLYGSV